MAAAAADAASFAAQTAEFIVALDALEQLLAKLDAASTEKDARELQLRVAVQLLQVRQRHRRLCNAREAARLETERAKAEVDRAVLEHHSVLYQKTHLQKELSVLREFAWEGPEPPLVPLAEFRAAAPPRLQSDDPHALELNRHTFELEERRRLIAELDATKQQRDALKASIAEKQKVLGSLQGRIEEVHQVTQSLAPLLSAADALPPADTRAELLPTPLYTLYHAAWALSHTMEPSLNVSLEGDFKAAAAALPTAAGEQPSKRPRLPLAVDPLAALAWSPVSVALHHAESDLRMIVRYAPSHNFVAVKVTEGKDRRDLTPTLTHLFPDDSGLDGLPKFDRAVVGAPYYWAQTLCGLYHLHPREARFGEPTLVETFRRIRQRSSARESLQAQLGALSKGQLVSLAPLAAELPEVTPQTVLSKFAAEADGAAFRALGPPSEGGALQWWESAAQHFRCVLALKGWEVHALVQVHVDYPLRPPCFRLQLVKAPLKHSVPPALAALADAQAVAAASSQEAANHALNHYLRDIEREVNAFSNAAHPLLLTAQLRRLQVAVDVMAQAHQGGVHQGQLFLAAFYGRERALPLQPSGAGFRHRVE